ncbi:uncharacterized protein [Palaemon carinicauda]|uniref:uncharacterized protein n=1 Tax=Palaemon carinicauda TaxID=392227 RepID=UPI0035B605AB
MRWISPDGRENVVRYTADENGYVVHSNVVPGHHDPLGEPVLQNNSSSGTSSNETSEEDGLLSLVENQPPNDMYNDIPIGLVPFPLRPKNESKISITTEPNDSGRSTEQIDKVITTIGPFSTTELHNFENASDAIQASITTTTAPKMEISSPMAIVFPSVYHKIEILKNSIEEPLTTISVISSEEIHTTEPTGEGKNNTTERPQVPLASQQTTEATSVSPETMNTEFSTEEPLKIIPATSDEESHTTNSSLEDGNTSTIVPLSTTTSKPIEELPGLTETYSGFTETELPGESLTTISTALNEKSHTTESSLFMEKSSTPMVPPTTISSNQEDKSILVTESLNGSLQNKIPETGTKESLTTTYVPSNDENHTTESSTKGESVTTEAPHAETDVSVSITTETLMGTTKAPTLSSDDDGITEMAPVANENIIEEMSMKNLSTNASDTETGITNLADNLFYFEDGYIKETTSPPYFVDETIEKRHPTYIPSTSEAGPLTTVLPVDHDDNGKNGMNTEIPLDFEYYDEEDDDDGEITELPPTLNFGDKVKHILEMTPLDDAKTSTPPSITTDKNTNETLGIPLIIGEDNDDGSKMVDSQIIMITNDNNRVTTTYYPQKTTEFNKLQNVTTVSPSSTVLMQDNMQSSTDVSNNIGTTESVPLVIAVKGVDSGEESMSGQNKSMATQESMNNLNSTDDNNLVHDSQMTDSPVNNSLSSNSTVFSDTKKVTDIPTSSPPSTTSSDNMTVESENGVSPEMPLDNEIVEGGSEESSPTVPTDSEVIEDAEEPGSAVPSDNEELEDDEEPGPVEPLDDKAVEEVAEEPSSSVPSDNEKVEGGAQETEEGTPSTNQITPVITPKPAPQKPKKKKGQATSPESIFANALLNRLFPTTRSPLIKEVHRPCYGPSLLCLQPNFHPSSSNPNPYFQTPPYHHVPPTHHHPFKPLFDVFPGTPRPGNDRLNNGQVFSYFH